MSNKANFLTNIIINEPVIRRVMVVEKERNQAIRELLEENVFAPTKEGLIGPFVFSIEMVENGQALYCKIQNESEIEVDCFKLSLKPFRRIIKDYFQICESYYDAVKRLSSAQLETIDMARRAIHDESAELLQRVFERHVTVDIKTSRRLFTLITVMHIRG